MSDPGLRVTGSSNTCWEVDQAAGGLEYDNISTTVRMGFGKLDLSARAHWMDFDDFMISLGGGINF